jgi:hypothetical protein
MGNPSRPHAESVIEKLRNDPGFVTEYLQAAINQASEEGGREALLSAVRHVADATAFDPWTADRETAKLAQDGCGLEWANSCGPVFQASAAKQIAAAKSAIDAGNGFAVLTCIRQCVTHGLVAPEWLAYAFNRRYDAVSLCLANSWDSTLAFGKPYPGRQLNALRKARTKTLAVWLAVREVIAREPGTPIDKGLFERVGEPLGLGATLAEEFYYKAKQEMNYGIAVADAAVDISEHCLTPKPVAKNTAKRKKSAGILRKAR